MCPSGKKKKMSSPHQSHLTGHHPSSHLTCHHPPITSHIASLSTNHISSFSTAGSDHRIVSASIQLSLRSSKKSPPHPMKTIDWRSVSQDKDLSARFSIAVHNKFQILSSNSELELGKIDDIYSNLSSAIIETATEMLPKMKSAARKPASTTISI